MKKTAFILLLFNFLALGLYAQDMDSILNQMSSNVAKEKVEATFKSTHLVLLNTNETQKKYDLAFWIAHRFGDIGGKFGGSHTLYGLDAATDIFIGFDYGITDKLTVGFGRSRANELYNFLIKYRLLEQQKEGFPFAVTLFSQAGWITRAEFNNSEFLKPGDRLSYNLQAIIARKFSSNFSAMVLPGILIRKDRIINNNPEALYSLGIGGRLKITKRFSLIADYTWVNGLGRNKDFNQGYYNPLGVGIEMETGGHVFSLNFMNATSIIENNFIADTQKSWKNGGVRFGFGISRNFTLFNKIKKKN
ncbi:hypothetical protein I5M32_03530 [Pedobacter sp. SD-b]|uniref:DUF5777 domain-containing protein n=1 Tax=Pedobacter segetis TaxID=2793069 RepID=A0ABS1BGN2_9SPHI|nr:DUF5777 family beta-barrel protein [Pedobacter segetis]MBK0382020.1 hypothetical protein [Pedobacter segetis]